MKLKDTFINQGGMMRCCLASISEYVDKYEDEEAEDELTIPCLYERPNPKKPNGRLVLHLEGTRAVWRIDLD